MNERIKKLAEQSGLIFVPPSVDYFGERHTGGILKDDLDVEKFAELIVKECFRVALVEGRGYLDPVKLRDAMNKHFGVEE